MKEKSENNLNKIIIILAVAIITVLSIFLVKDMLSSSRKKDPTPQEVEKKNDKISETATPSSTPSIEST